MTVFGYTAGVHSEPAALAAAGATPFAAMAELPALLRAGPCPTGESRGAI
jgi:hypothetical protein